MMEAKEIIRRRETARAQRMPLTSLWRECADYCRPVEDYIDTQEPDNKSPNQTRLDALFDTTAIYANQTYAAGCMSWMTPSEVPWMSFDSPDAFKGNDAIAKWYRKCTEEVQLQLSLSNFYQTIHETYLNDGAFGTSGIVIDDDGGTLNFETLQIGSFDILEDHRRRVDTVFQEVRFTPRQASQRFGIENLSRDMKEVLAQNGPAIDQPCDFIRAVMPRDDYEKGKLDAENMPWAVVWVDRKAKHIVREGGAWEMPTPVNRHLLWGRSPYGFAPAFMALADARQLNDLQANLDALVELQVDPRILAPSEFKGSKVDLRAGGVTYFKQGGTPPTEWATGGRYDIANDRVLMRRDSLNEAFHVQMFQSLKGVPPGKEMTATEVAARQRDRLTLFSPTFANKTTELLTPTIQRVFGILLRAGSLPEPPAGLVQINQATGLPEIPDPKIVYTSRLALQIKAIHNDAIQRALMQSQSLFAIDPTVADHIDAGKSFRMIARNEGVPEDILRSPGDVERIQQQRAEAQAQAAQQQQAIEEAGAVSDLAKGGLV